MQSRGECKAKGVPEYDMDEGRKRVLGIVAAPQIDPGINDHGKGFAP
jgi:hypothetical protein